MQSIFQIKTKLRFYGTAIIKKTKALSQVPVTALPSQLINGSDITSNHRKTNAVKERGKLRDNTMSDFQKLESKLADFRSWEPCTPKSYPNHQNDTSGGTAFTVVSYNILAQTLLESHLYLYDKHDRRALDWKSRFDRLIREILLLHPHILCLQEVQKSHLDQIKAALKPLHLKVIYKKRTGFKDDGCAIFYNENMFECEEHQSVEYYQPQIQILNRENVAIIAKFSLKENRNSRFVVATTHLLYNPRRQDVRLAQIQVLLAELDRIAMAPKNYFPVILTGDFNLQPYSAPYRLITQGILNYEALSAKTLEFAEEGNQDMCGKLLLPQSLGITDDCKHVFGVSRDNKKCTKLYHSERECNIESKNASQSTSRNTKFGTGELRHMLNFSSAYNHNIGSREQEATTFQHSWISCDYIFFSKAPDTSTNTNNLVLLSRYKLPSIAKCANMGMIPNLYFGSDHLALAAKFLLTNNNKQKPNL